MNREIPLTDTLVNNYLDVVTATDGSPLSLIVPKEAGPQTFPLIAAALKQMEGQLYDLVVLVSGITTNQVQLQAKGILSTPLGRLEVDEKAAAKILSKMPGSKSLPLGLNKESNLVQDSFNLLAAFVKQIAPYSKVLPLLLSANGFKQALELGGALADTLQGKQAVVIAQADLDQTLLAALEFNDPEIFKQTAFLMKSKPESELDQPEISAAPAAAALDYAAANSGNTVSVLQKAVRSGLHQAAVMLWEYQPPRLTQEQEADLLTLASRAIKSYVTTGLIPEAPTNDPLFNRKAGVFVTLRIQGMLRGCIGHMAAERPLAQAVQEMAVAAATSDPRFPPLSEAELEQITIKVAILSPMQRIDYRQVEVGKHGLLISSSGRRGVLLPEVAAERGWDRETYLENLCYKAGLPADTWRQNPTLYAFTSVVFGEG